MISVRKAQDRGHFDFGWLKTWHSFSFGEYFDPQHHGFRNLRVINEDFVAPKHGFPMHPHRDMEIITYVMKGALEHRDSLGNGDIIRPGDVQRMSAGSGIRHSEANPMPGEATHLYQIWILPSQRGIAPGYEQQKLPFEDRANRLKLVAAPKGEGATVSISADARLYAANLDAGKALSLDLAKGRHAWLQVAHGEVTLNGHPLQTSDGAAVSDTARLEIRAARDAEILLFDLA
ncbi:MAG TPA: pirin family protein [Planctomycetota bacterium]|nr:pirin family protein [Planctomycetota bacterium]